MKTHISILIITLHLLACGVVSAQQGDLDKGIELYKNGDYKKSAAILQNVVKDASAPAGAWNFLGLAQLKNGKAKEAETAFARAISLDANDASFHLGRAFALMLLQNFKEAGLEADAAIKLDPKNAQAYYVAGRVALDAGRLDVAYDHALKAIEFEPKLASAYYLKAESLFAALKSNESIPKSPVMGVRSLRDIADALEQYLALSPSGDDSKTLTKSLEVIKSFADFYLDSSGAEAATRPPDVPAKATPVKIITKPRANFTELARMNSFSGKCRLLAAFGSNGKIEHVVLLEPVPYGLGEECLRASSAIQFEPATLDGKPVTALRILEYAFTVY